MINKIRIQNFQSHADTSIELSPNITTFVGVSDSGKSAILRAIYAVIERSPFYIRNGTEEGKVSLQFKDKEISRHVSYTGLNKCVSCKEPLKQTGDSTTVCKCGEVNTVKVAKDFYLLDGEKKEKFGVKLNDELATAIRMSPVKFVDIEENLNSTRQFDDHFFIGTTYAGSKRNKIISSLIVDSEKVDLLLQKISSELRDDTSKLNVYQSEVIYKREKLKAIKEDFEEAVKLREDILNNKLKEISDKLTGIQAIVSQLQELSKMDNLESHVVKCGKGLKLMKDQLSLSKQKGNTILRLKTFQDSLSHIPDVTFTKFVPETSEVNVSAIKSKYYKLESFQTSLEGIDELAIGLSSSVEKIKSDITTIKTEKDKEIDKMDICPVTKQTMSKSCKEILKGKSNG